jgi:hypothetical protein
MRGNLILGKFDFLYGIDLEINKRNCKDDISWWLYVCDTYEMMDIESRNIEKKAIVMTLEPYGFHGLPTASECMVVSWHSHYTWKPWQDGFPEGICSREWDS